VGIEILAQEFGPERDQAMAGPLGLFVTVFLVVVTIFLIRGMNKHVRRLNERVAREAAAEAAAAADDDEPRA
jgi:Na+-transporting methylmalonyl-CoA/oxaloacetate decarboxylase gamma subunit